VGFGQSPLRHTRQRAVERADERAVERAVERVVERADERAVEFETTRGSGAPSVALLSVAPLSVALLSVALGPVAFDCSPVGRREAIIAGGVGEVVMRFKKVCLGAVFITKSSVSPPAVKIPIARQKY